jgi:hypothetical protein
MTSDEIIRAAQEIIKAAEKAAELTPWPPVPDANKTEKEFPLALYTAQLEGVKAQRRDWATALVTELELKNKREDTKLALENTREDTKLALENTREDTRLAREHTQQDTSAAAEDALRAAVQAAYLGVAQGQIDRSLKRAEFVTTAAGAIGTTYAGLLALAFSISAQQPHPFPARGLAPAVFLAVSFVMSVIYVAFLHRSTADLLLLPSGTDAGLQESRLTTFLKWVNLGLLRRTWALRTAVISLGAGVALLPLPFIKISSTWAGVVIGIAAAAVVLWIALELGYWLATRNAAEPSGVPTPTLGR